MIPSSPVAAPGGRAVRGVALAVVSVATVVCLAWVVGRAGPGALLRALAGFRPTWGLAVFAAWTGTVLLRAVRLALLLPSPVAARPLAAVTAVGALAGSVLPLRLGEAVRPWLLADRHGVPFGEGVGAFLLERLLDLIALLLLIAWVAATAPTGLVVGGVDLVRAGAWAVGTGALGVLGLVLAAARVGPSVLARLGPLLARSPRLGPPIARQGAAFVDAVRLVGSPWRTGGAVVATAALWAVTVGAVLAVTAGFDGPLAPDVAARAWTAIMTAMLLVPSPGFLGVFEAAGTAALEAQGLDVADAAAIAVALHASMLASYGLLGALGALSEGLAARASGKDRHPPRG